VNLGEGLLEVNLRAHRPLSLFVYVVGVVLAFSLIASETLRGGATSQDVVFLALFGILALYACYLGLWSALGVERISASRAGIQVERRLFGMTLSSNEYSRLEITELRINPISQFTLAFGSLRNALRIGSFFGIGVGPIVIEYSGREARIAEGLRQDRQATHELFLSLSTALGIGSEAVVSAEFDDGLPGDEWEPFG